MVDIIRFYTKRNNRLIVGLFINLESLWAILSNCLYCEQLCRDKLVLIFKRDVFIV